MDAEIELDLRARLMAHVHLLNGLWLARTAGVALKDGIPGDEAATRLADWLKSSIADASYPPIVMERVRAEVASFCDLMIDTGRNWEEIGRPE